MKSTVTIFAFRLASTFILSLISAGAHADAVDGKALFARNCAACHQASGTGIPGAFPALKGNLFAQGDASPVIATVLKGRAGMPAFAASLDDEKLASVVTYIRSAWGNHATPITTADIASVRTAASAAPVTQEKASLIH